MYISIYFFILGKFNLTSIAPVKSYNYSKLVICYGGAQRQATATFQWNANTKSFKILFGRKKSFTNWCIYFLRMWNMSSQCYKCVAGSMGISSNAHTLVEEQLEDHLNRNKNLAQLIHILHETYPPLVSINKLPTMPHLYVVNSVRKVILIWIRIIFVQF